PAKPAPMMTIRLLMSPMLARAGHSLAERWLGDRRMVAGRAVADGWVAPGENWDLPGHLTASLLLPLVGTVTVWRAPLRRGRAVSCRACRRRPAGSGR